MAKKKNATPVEDRPTSSLADFKSKKRGKFELPSGMVVKLKNPGGLQAFIANGTIPNSLLSIVQQGLNGGTSIDAMKEAAELSKDLDSIKEMMQLLDIVAVQTIVEPPCRRAPTQDDVTRWNLTHPGNEVESPDDLRDDEKYLYTDDLDELDKQYIMQWVTGGNSDLETFRKEQEKHVAAVSAVAGAKDATELPAGAEEG